MAPLAIEVGTSEMDATALQRRIGARTGGLSTAMLFEQACNRMQ